MTVRRDGLSRAADIVRAALVGAAGVFLAVGDGSAGLKALLLLAPALVGRFARVPPAFDLVFALALTAEAFGTKLGAYDSISWGDTLSHTALPFFSGPIAYGVLATLGIAAEPGTARSARALVAAATVTAVAILVLGVAWELVEWAADGALGTEYSQGYDDTRADLVNDAVAAVASGILVAVWLGLAAPKPALQTATTGPLRAAEPARATAHNAAGGASVVIPTHNRRDEIELTVRAALADPATREVIVVVDGCHDGTLERLRQIAEEEPRVRPLWQENAGASTARQRGVKYARYPIVVLLDDDVVAEPGLITGHVAHHARGSHQLVLGYMPVVARSTWPENVTACLYSMSYEDQVRLYETDPGQILTCLWAGNMSVRRSHALEVALEDPAVRLGYLADRELGLRLMKAGFTGVFDRSLRGSHHCSRSLDGRRRDPETTARDTWKLHEVHGDVIGPLPPDPWDDAAWPRRLVVRLGAGPAGPGVRMVLWGVVYAFGRLGVTRAAARHLGLIFQALEKRTSVAEGGRTHP